MPMTYATLKRPAPRRGQAEDSVTDLRGFVTARKGRALLATPTTTSPTLTRGQRDRAASQQARAVAPGSVGPILHTRRTLTLVKGSRY